MTLSTLRSLLSAQQESNTEQIGGESMFVLKDDSTANINDPIEIQSSGDTKAVSAHIASYEPPKCLTMYELDQTSESIKSFLDFLRQVESRYKTAQQEEVEMNRATSDIMHAVELEVKTDYTPSQLVKLIRQIRKTRRVAKDTQIVLAPVVDWINKNKNIIKALETLLGDTRKAEGKLVDRSYVPRTTVMGDNDIWSTRK